VRICVGATDNVLATAFQRPAQFGGVNGTAYQPWGERRDTVKKFLSDTDYHLTEAAHALMLAV
jgi:hypothetical protein